MLDQWFDQSLQSLVAALRDYRPSVLIGVSGTFDTLTEIYSIREGLPPVHDSRETPLTQAGFIEIHEELIRKNRGERMQIQGMIEMRVDMIVVTSCLIRWLVDKHSFTRLRVSSWSLKEGAMMQLARGNGLAWDGTSSKS